MKITLDEWRSAHLFSVNSASDVYYVKLANKMRDYIRFVGLDDDLDEEEQYELAKCVAYYFEDVISNIGIWGAFVTKHKELYGKYLPFYDIDETEYYLDEINFEDIRFLVWIGVQQFREDSFVNPENLVLLELAQAWYELLDKEFEKAPINTRLVEHIYSSEWFDDFLSVKQWCSGLYATMYLLQDELELLHIEDVVEEMSEVLSSEGEMSVYAAYSFLAFSSKIGPLALTMPEWLSCMLKNRGMEREAGLLANIKVLRYNLYLMKKIDKEVLTLESLNGDTYIVDCSSLSDIPDNFSQIKTVMCSLALYGDGNWQVNGAISCFEDKKIITQMRKKQKAIDANAKRLYAGLMKASKNYPLLYFSDYDEMSQWIEKHVGYVSDYVHPEEMKDSRNIAAFILPNGRFSILCDGASWIKDDRNPCYNPEAAKKNAISLLYDPEVISKEMLHYLLEHQLLPDACINSLHGHERGRQLVQENMDFIARMFRRYMY